MATTLEPRTADVAAPRLAWMAVLPAVKGTELVGLAAALAQLSLVLAVLYQYQLETRTFFYVMTLAVAGFAVHAVLPLRYRLAFFVGLSFAGIFIAFGAVDGLWLILAGGALIGLCHLPVAWGWRIAALLGLGAVLAAARVQLLPTPVGIAVWPILGSMFMFRLALYV
jgi:hypothetical protein